MGQVFKDCFLSDWSVTAESNSAHYDELYTQYEQINNKMGTKSSYFVPYFLGGKYQLLMAI